MRARVRLHASPRRRLRAGVSLPAFYRHRASGTLTCDGRVDGVLLESTPDLRQPPTMNWRRPRPTFTSIVLAGQEEERAEEEGRTPAAHESLLDYASTHIYTSQARKPAAKKSKPAAKPAAAAPKSKTKAAAAAAPAPAPAKKM